MKKTLFALVAVAASLMAAATATAGVAAATVARGVAHVVNKLADPFCLHAGPRMATRDVAFGFRMGAGFPGDINRTHPFSVEPGLMNTTNPIRLYGDPGLINSADNTYRGFIAGDTSVTKIDGVLVRPYPVQQTTGGMNSPIGAAAAPVAGVIDMLNDGYIMVKCNNFAVNAPSKGGAVFVRTAATAGNLVQGGFHAADDGANAVEITNARWNGPADANGVAELVVWKTK